RFIRLVRSARMPNFVLAVIWIAMATYQPDEPSDPSPISPTSPRRVLVVDDNVGSTQLMSAMLTKFWKHEVRVAHDGHQALEIAQEFRPDIVLLDIGLPILNGYEV